MAQQGVMGDLESILPEELRRRALVLEGNRTSPSTELVLPYGEALTAITFATEHQIAVLGLEAFEVQKDGLLTLDLTDGSSRIPFTGDWKAYVAAINAEAERWIKEHRLGENHGYILTSASQTEFAMLPHLIK